MNHDFLLGFSLTCFVLSYFAWKAFLRADHVESIGDQSSAVQADIGSIIANFDAVMASKARGGAGDLGAPTASKPAAPSRSVAQKKVLTDVLPEGWVLHCNVELKQVIEYLGASEADVAKATRVIDFLMVDAASYPQLAVFVGPLAGDDEQAELGTESGVTVMTVAFDTRPTSVQVRNVLAQL